MRTERFFDQFSDEAVSVMVNAEAEARRSGHNFIGTEHLLLGILLGKKGNASRALIGLGATIDTARSEVEKIIGRGSGFVTVEIPLTPRTKRVLEGAHELQVELKALKIEDAHILLALWEAGSGVAIQVLENMGLTFEQIRASLFTLMEASGTDETALTTDIIGAKALAVARTPTASLSTTEVRELEQFSDEAIRVVIFAQEEGRRLGQKFIGTEQLLLGMLREENGCASRALKSLGVTIEESRNQVERIIGVGSEQSTGHIRLTPRAKRTFEAASQAHLKFGSASIHSEHILLALLQDGEGVAIRALENMNLGLSKVKTALLDIMEINEDVDRAALETFRAVLPVCPNCAEPVKPGAQICYGCKYGIADESFENCPFCRERIRLGALKCRYCLSQLPPKESS